MVYLLKIVIFHGYVSLPEGITTYQWATWCAMAQGKRPPLCMILEPTRRALRAPSIGMVNLVTPHLDWTFENISTIIYVTVLYIIYNYKYIIIYIYIYTYICQPFTKGSSFWTAKQTTASPRVRLRDLAEQTYKCSWSQRPSLVGEGVSYSGCYRGYSYNLPLVGYSYNLPLVGYSYNLPLVGYSYNLPLVGYINQWFVAYSHH